MEKPDRAAYARRNRAWLIPAFLAALVLGLLRENAAAVAAGVIGLLWVGHAVWVVR